ncbi:MAG: glycosyltransferase [Planctomycetes bacterium]|nr:glycosyltransferase [Planctomycetota bacterium]MCC7171075.1 glycosyltransferase [Planctomycetota bacterium]
MLDLTSLRSRVSVFVLLVAFGALAYFSVREVEKAQKEIDLILDEGVVGLDRAEDMLQSLLDLRAAVISSLLPATAADRIALARELDDRLAALDRQNDRLAELQLEHMLREDESLALKGLVDVAEESVRQIVTQIRTPGGDVAVSVRDATDVSAEIDACAAELHALSTRVAGRARVADSEIPDALTNAQHLTVAMASLSFAIALFGLVRVVASRRSAVAEYVAKRALGRTARVPVMAAPEPRLRIVHVLSHTDATRGGAIQALLLAREQKRAGHDVVVIANSKSRHRAAHATFRPWMDAGIEIRFLPMGAPQRVWMSPRGVMRMRSLLRSIPHDVIHVHRDRALLYVLAATAGMEPPALISQRGTTRRFRHVVIAVAHRSPCVHRIVAVAQAVKDSLVEQNVDAAKVEVVYGSFDVGRFDPERVDRARARRELGIADDQFVLLALGELNPRKDPATYIDAFARVMTTHPEVVALHAGDAKAERRTEYERLGAERCGERLRFLGWRPDVPELLAAADVVVNASVGDEGLTGTVREALAMGKAVVCTKTDGNPELIEDGVTGILVQKRKPEVMARAIETLLADPALRARLGAAGRQRVLERMTLAVRVPRVEQIYREVLAERLAAAGPGRAAPVGNAALPP